MDGWIEERPVSSGYHMKQPEQMYTCANIRRQETVNSGSVLLPTLESFLTMVCSGDQQERGEEQQNSFPALRVWSRCIIRPEVVLSQCHILLYPSNIQHHKISSTTCCLRRISGSNLFLQDT